MYVQKTMNDDLRVIERSGIEISLLDGDLSIIQKLDDEPNDVGGLTAQELKAKFDEAGLTIQRYINETLVPEVLSEGATERARQTAETARQTAEQARQSAETTRARNEDARDTAERNRNYQELQRLTGESERKSAESARQSAEDARDTAETDRQDAEESRRTAETDREAAETGRQQWEAVRKSAEADRNHAEQARRAAEEDRVEAEQARRQAQEAFMGGVAAAAKTLGPGSAATATVIAENGSFRLELGIPRGEAGPRGPQGEGIPLKGVYTQAEFDALPESERKSGIYAIDDGAQPAGGGGGGVPSGVICMWSGAADNVPGGWAVCDGENGTPDLRGRFVLGTGAAPVYYAFSSQNGGVNSSTAEIALTPKKDIPAMTICYQVRSEANYDKFTVWRGTDRLVSDVSGVVDASVEVTGLTAADTLTFTYSKDGSGDKNGDMARFWIELPGGGNVTEELLGTLFEVDYPKEYRFAGGNFSPAAMKAPGETGGSESVKLTTNNLPSHSHTQEMSSGDEHSSWAYEYETGYIEVSETSKYFDVDAPRKRIPAGAKVGILGTRSTGESAPFSIMPPYYALCYIMKL